MKKRGKKKRVEKGDCEVQGQRTKFIFIEVESKQKWTKIHSWRKEQFVCSEAWWCCFCFGLKNETETSGASQLEICFEKRIFAETGKLDYCNQ